jgi:hypothetical protein
VDLGNRGEGQSFLTPFFDYDEANSCSIQQLGSENLAKMAFPQDNIDVEL